MTEKLNYYTQREWDRTVGIGKVPKEYQRPKKELKPLQDDVLVENLK
jgi:hypothetical protein|tara:strand:- start:306 stop:446 length:141 start_codon:yes stop_codon:yes gene_type:complete